MFWRSNYTWAVRQGPWKLIVDELSGNRVLYNLDLDKPEQHNLYAHSPDIVKMLESAYNQWKQRNNFAIVAARHGISL
ncbi:MAG: hypothetical protein IPP17_11590 [Bacteroidetes bacterium]|nr:hypothetical protein [Bacteroidota bacterium]